MASPYGGGAGGGGRDARAETFALTAVRGQRPEETLAPPPVAPAPPSSATPRTARSAALPSHSMASPQHEQQQRQREMSPPRGRRPSYGGGDGGAGTRRASGSGRGAATATVTTTMANRQHVEQDDDHEEELLSGSSASEASSERVDPTDFQALLHKRRVAQIALEDWLCKDYFRSASGPLQPGVYFYKWLGMRAGGKIRINIPDTVYYSDGGHHWIYTDKEGVVRHVHKAGSSGIQKFVNVCCYSNPSIGLEHPLDRVVAVQKMATWKKSVASRCLALTPASLYCLLMEEMEAGSESMAFQRFVKCRGKRACVYRVHWRDGSAPTGYSLANKKPFSPYMEPIGRTMHNDMASLWTSCPESYRSTWPEPLTQPSTHRMQNKLPDQKLTAGSLCPTADTMNLLSVLGKRGLAAQREIGQTYMCSCADEDGIVSLESAARISATKLIGNVIRGPAEQLRAAAAVIQTAIRRAEGLPLRLSEVVGDFARDDKGTWWLLQVKGFRVAPDCQPELHRWYAAETAEAKDDFEVMADEAQPEDAASTAASWVVRERERQREALARVKDAGGTRCHMCGLHYFDDATVQLHDQTILAIGYKVTPKLGLTLAKRMRDGEMALTAEARDILQQFATSLSEVRGVVADDTEKNAQAAAGKRSSAVLMCHMCFRILQSLHRLSDVSARLSQALGLRRLQHNGEQHNHADESPDTIELPGKWRRDADDLSSSALVVPPFHKSQRSEPVVSTGLGSQDDLFPLRVVVAGGAFKEGDHVWKRRHMPAGTCQWRLLFLCHYILDLDLPSYHRYHNAMAFLVYSMGQTTHLLPFRMTQQPGDQKCISVRQARLHYLFSRKQDLRTHVQKNRVRVAVWVVRQSGMQRFARSHSGGTHGPPTARTTEQKKARRASHAALLRKVSVSHRQLMDPAAVSATEHTESQSVAGDVFCEGFVDVSLASLRVSPDIGDGTDKTDTIIPLTCKTLGTAMIKFSAALIWDRELPETSSVLDTADSESNIHDLKFMNEDGIFWPPDVYCTKDPLPGAWLAMMTAETPMGEQGRSNKGRLRRGAWVADSESGDSEESSDDEGSRRNNRKSNQIQPEQRAQDPDDKQPGGGDGEDTNTAEKDKDELAAIRVAKSWREGHQEAADTLHHRESVSRKRLLTRLFSHQDDLLLEDDELPEEDPGTPTNGDADNARRGSASSIGPMSPAKKDEPFPREQLKIVFDSLVPRHDGTVDLNTLLKHLDIAYERGIKHLLEHTSVENRSAFALMRSISVDGVLEQKQQGEDADDASRAQPSEAEAMLLEILQRASGVRAKRRDRVFKRLAALLRQVIRTMPEGEAYMGWNRIVIALQRKWTLSLGGGTSAMWSSMISAGKRRMAVVRGVFKKLRPSSFGLPRCSVWRRHRRALLIIQLFTPVDFTAMDVCDLGELKSHLESENGALKSALAQLVDAMPPQEQTLTAENTDAALLVLKNETSVDTPETTFVRRHLAHILTTYGEGLSRQFQAYDTHAIGSITLLEFLALCEDGLLRIASKWTADRKRTALLNVQTELDKQAAALAAAQRPAPLHNHEQLRSLRAFPDDASLAATSVTGSDSVFSEGADSSEEKSEAGDDLRPLPQRNPALPFSKSTYRRQRAASVAVAKHSGRGFAALGISSRNLRPDGPQSNSTPIGLDAAERQRQRQRQQKGERGGGPADKSTATVSPPSAAAGAASRGTMETRPSSDSDEALSKVRFVLSTGCAPKATREFRALCNQQEHLSVDDHFRKEVCQWVEENDLMVGKGDEKKHRHQRASNKPDQALAAWVPHHHRTTTGSSSGGGDSSSSSSSSSSANEGQTKARDADNSDKGGRPTGGDGNGSAHAFTGTGTGDGMAGEEKPVPAAAEFRLRLATLLRADILTVAALPLESLDTARRVNAALQEAADNAEDSAAPKALDSGKSEGKEPLAADEAKEQEEGGTGVQKPESVWEKAFRHDRFGVGAGYEPVLLAACVRHGWVSHYVVDLCCVSCDAEAIDAENTRRFQRGLEDDSLTDSSDEEELGDEGAPPAARAAKATEVMLQRVKGTAIREARKSSLAAVKHKMLAKAQQARKSVQQTRQGRRDSRTSRSPSPAKSVDSRGDAGSEGIDGEKPVLLANEDAARAAAGVEDDDDNDVEYSDDSDAAEEGRSPFVEGVHATSPFETASGAAGSLLDPTRMDSSRVEERSSAEAADKEDGEGEGEGEGKQELRLSLREQQLQEHEQRMRRWSRFAKPTGVTDEELERSDPILQLVRQASVNCNTEINDPYEPRKRRSHGSSATTTGRTSPSARTPTDELLRAAREVAERDTEDVHSANSVGKTKDDKTAPPKSMTKNPGRKRVATPRAVRTSKRDPATSDTEARLSGAYQAPTRAHQEASDRKRMARPASRTQLQRPTPHTDQWGARAASPISPAAETRPSAATTQRQRPSSAAAARHAKAVGDVGRRTMSEAQLDQRARGRERRRQARSQSPTASPARSRRSSPPRSRSRSRTRTRSQSPYMSRSRSRSRSRSPGSRGPGSPELRDIDQRGAYGAEGKSDDDDDDDVRSYEFDVDFEASEAIPGHRPDADYIAREVDPMDPYELVAGRPRARGHAERGRPQQVYEPPMSPETKSLLAALGRRQQSAKQYHQRIRQEIQSIRSNIAATVLLQHGQQPPQGHKAPPARRARSANRRGRRPRSAHR